MDTIPSFSFTGEYFLFILSVTLTTLLILFAASLLRAMRRKTFPTWQRKLAFFPVFIVGIFTAGWFTAKLQQLVYAYLQQNVATSVTGILVSIVVAWFLYDFAIWRGH